MPSTSLLYLLPLHKSQVTYTVGKKCISTAITPFPSHCSHLPPATLKENLPAFQPLYRVSSKLANRFLICIKAPTYVAGVDLVQMFFLSVIDLSKQRRCEQCEGNGVIAVEMHFLPTVYVTCDLCKGKRYNKEVLGIKYKKKNIYDILSMSVEDAVKFFKDIPNIYDRIKTLEDVGLGYITLGQPSTTLSGGEAQRVKISSELYRKNTTKTVYLLDEPTVGLHYEDVRKLIEILNKLVDRENSVIVIEHNMDIIKSSDYVVDVGPEGGDGGGKVVCSGTPEQIACNKESHTGKFIKKTLKKEKHI